jgi:hypothetical protein
MAAEQSAPWGALWREMRQMTVHLNRVVRSARSLPPSESAYFVGEIARVYDLVVYLARVPLALLAPDAVPAELQATTAGELPILRRAMARHGLGTDELWGAVALGKREAQRWSDEP